MTTTHTQGCQHTHRALGWTIITSEMEPEYGSDNDSRTLDQIGRDLHEMQVRGQNPLLVEIGDCLNCKRREWAQQDNLIGRYRMRLAIGEVAL
jgi:hypothetical protein